MSLISIMVPCKVSPLFALSMTKTISAGTGSIEIHIVCMCSWDGFNSDDVKSSCKIAFRNYLILDTEHNNCVHHVIVHPRGICKQSGSRPFVDSSC